MKFYVEQVRSESYMSCLDIWCSFVDFLTGVIDSKSAASDVVKAKYREALTSLVAQAQWITFTFGGLYISSCDPVSLWVSCG